MANPPTHPPKGDPLLPSPPANVREAPLLTDAQRSRGVAHMDDLLAHINDPPEEPDWDPQTLFPPGRVR